MLIYRLTYMCFTRDIINSVIKLIYYGKYIFLINTKNLKHNLNKNPITSH